MRKIKEEKDHKRALKLEELRKQEEAKQLLEREKQRLQEARDYYNRSLLIKYGIWAFAKNVERARMLEEAAESQRVKWVLKNG